MNNDDTIPHRIANARNAANLTQQQVADALQLPVSKIDEIESGIRPVSTLELARLAHLLRRPISSFVTGVMSANPNYDCGDLAVLVQQRLDSITARGHGSPTDEDMAQLRDLVLDAYRKGQITAGKLRDVGAMLGVSVETLSQLMDNTE
ncbi:MAG: helix-turn-helix transcriptional regulator [Planctomycetaceae bacterium]|nr:helix-turn-helix transcriptional regulator [Planctomycetaceae bacterium]